MGGRVELATELVDFTQNDDSGRSTVRKRAGIDFVSDTDERPSPPCSPTSVSKRWARRRATRGVNGCIALSPLAGTDLLNLTGAPPADGSSVALKVLQGLVDEASGRSDSRTWEIVWATVWWANVRVAARFQEGRVLLVGDAAHVCSPTGGQRLNTGVQDAYNLGWKSVGPRELADTYAVERLTIAHGVLELGARTLRKHVNWDEDVHQRGAEFHQKALNYRGGPLSRDERATPWPLRAGDRAPDAPCQENGAATRLYGLFQGPGWTRLEFRDGVAITGDRVLADADGHARAAYGAEGFVLVRPDGYVGLVADHRDAVGEYLESVAVGAGGARG